MVGKKIDPNLGKKEEILEFVRMNPGCTTVQISEGCSVKVLSRVGMYLVRLKNLGLAESVKLPKDQRLQWHAVERESEGDGEPVRIVKTQWIGHANTDPLTAALFGSMKR